MSLKTWVATDKGILPHGVLKHLCASPGVWTGGPFTCYGHRVTLNVVLPINLPVPILIPLVNIFHNMHSLLRFLQNIIKYSHAPKQWVWFCTFWITYWSAVYGARAGPSCHHLSSGAYGKLLSMVSILCPYFLSLLKTLPLWDQSHFPQVAVLHPPLPSFKLPSLHSHASPLWPLDVLPTFPACLYLRVFALGVFSA